MISDVLEILEFRDFTIGTNYFFLPILVFHSILGQAGIKKIAPTNG
jgi:hypothetical protein